MTGAVMASAYLRSRLSPWHHAPALLARVDDDTPVKSDIPASANQQGYLEIDSPNMESLPIAPTVGKRTRAGIPACLSFTSVTGAKQTRSAEHRNQPDGYLPG